MRKQALAFALVLVGTTLALGAVFTQEDEDVRGAFLTSRPKENTSTPSTKPTKSSRRRPRAVPKNKPSPTPSPTETPVVKPVDPERPVTQRIGLGLTLFARDSNGHSVRVDPSHSFRRGDRVRFLLETNADGHLYIFNTTDDGPPSLIYPNPDLDEAGNFFRSHVPFEIPSSVSPEERLRWLTFDQNAGTEHLYFVFTREPLSAVPIEDDLIAYCSDSKNKCPWRPSEEIWEQIQKELNKPNKMAGSKRFGSTQTSGEQRAVSRGIGLSKEDPEPSLVVMTASSNSNRLVTMVELVHK